MAVPARVDDDDDDGARDFRRFLRERRDGCFCKDEFIGRKKRSEICIDF